ncbi:MAG: permease-like cell division protein FtsX [bacterium]|nr:permease-like cell division protein FtsX [bacterium]
MLTNFKRVFSFALTNFYRNKGIGVAAIFVLIITTLLVTSIFFVRGASNYLIQTVEDKIDIAAYFKADTAEEDILSVRTELLQDTVNIKSIEYVSKEDALATFLETHKDSEVFAQALTQVGGNPFLPSLNITTNKDAAGYEQIAQVLAQDKFAGFIEKVDFSQKKDTIEKVFSITSNVNRFGLGLAVFLVLIVILVVFNTIRLVIENSREEISTMRLVGAPNWFVKAPFIIEGGIFGFISFIICIILTLLAAAFLSRPLGVVMPGFNLFSYLISHLWLIILIQLAAGVGLGMFASLIVVRKYLKG